MLLKRSTTADTTVNSEMPISGYFCMLTLPDSVKIRETEDLITSVHSILNTAQLQVNINVKGKTETITQRRSLLDVITISNNGDLDVMVDENGIIAFTIPITGDVISNGMVSIPDATITAQFSKLPPSTEKFFYGIEDDLEVRSVSNYSTLIVDAGTSKKIKVSDVNNRNSFLYQIGIPTNTNLLNNDFEVVLYFGGNEPTTVKRTGAELSYNASRDDKNEIFYNGEDDLSIKTVTPFGHLSVIDFSDESFTEDIIAYEIINNTDSEMKILSHIIKTL